MSDLTPKEKYDLEKSQKEKVKNRKAAGQKAKKTSKWLFILIGVAVVIIGFVALGNGNQNGHNGGTATLESTTLEITENDWTKGSETAPVTLIEYSDFQCPACASYFPIVKSISEQMPETVRFVYRHFPLVSIHPNAIPGARAAEAAGQQDKFWEMHDLLFENQTQWSSLFNPKKTFITYAERLGLDLDQFETDYDSDELEDKVRNNLESALALGLNSTPSFVLNGERIPNPRNQAELVALIEAAAQGSAIPSDSAPAMQSHQ